MSIHIIRRHLSSKNFKIFLGLVLIGIIAIRGRIGPSTYTSIAEDSRDHELFKDTTAKPHFVVPEYPFGTISAIAVGLISILLVSKRQRISLRT